MAFGGCTDASRQDGEHFMIVSGTRSDCPAAADWARGALAASPRQWR
jgi:hypothetical protein